MIYLLDTHYVLWSLFEPARISETARLILANDSDSKFISGVNLWEISLKYSLGKLDLGGTNPSELFDKLLSLSKFHLHCPQSPHRSSPHRRQTKPEPD